MHRATCPTPRQASHCRWMDECRDAVLECHPRGLTRTLAKYPGGVGHLFQNESSAKSSVLLVGLWSHGQLRVLGRPSIASCVVSDTSG